MNYRLKHDYMSKRDAQLGVFGLHIKKSMTANPRFPNAGPLLDEAGTALDEFREGVSAATGRDKNAIAYRNTKRDALRTRLHALASHAIIAANNDLEALISSGFEVVKAGKAKKSTDELIVAVGKTPGQAISKFNGAPGARIFIHQYTLDPLSETPRWTQAITTKRKYVHTGLTDGVKYWFRVIAIDANEQETYSASIARVIIFQ